MRCYQPTVRCTLSVSMYLLTASDTLILVCVFEAQLSMIYLGACCLSLFELVFALFRQMRQISAQHFSFSRGLQS